MKKTRVIILFGGRSAEHEVSILSARNVLGALVPFPLVYDGRLRAWGQGEENVCALDQVDARRHHGRRVDQRAGWRRAGHRIR